MIKKTIKTAFLAFLLLGICLPSSGQILEVDPDEIGEPVARPPHTGLTLQGSSGLITVPTADFKETETFSASIKGCEITQDSTFSNTKFEVKKKEYYSGVAYNVTKNLELSLNYLEYKRLSKPYLTGLNYREDSVSGGIKYSTQNGKQDFCFGTTFAPMSAEELNKADLWQIENLRNIYFTVTEDIAQSFRGYIHVKACATDDQTIRLANNQTLRLDRKNFLISALALEYCKSQNFSVFCEGQFFNYRDIFKEDSTRFSFNGGLRFGSKNIQLEAMGLSLNENPRIYLGTSLGF